MKKFIALLLTGAFLLSACASPNPAPSSSRLDTLPVSTASQEVPAPEPAPEPEPDPQPEPEPEPDFEWQLDTPENHQMDPEQFTRLHQALPGSGIYAMVTVKDGVLIDEYYQEGYDETSVFPLHSCSKSFTSALIGIAIEQGYISGIDDLLSKYLPQVAGFTDGKQNLTLHHLLTQTSGLEWYEWGGSYSNWEEFQSAPNWIEYILGRNLVAQPGTLFNYSTGNTHLAAAALEQAVGMNEMEYAQTNLFQPLGMDSVEWRTDPQGITDGGNGIAMTARDAARFGQLYLQEGLWNGKQLVPKAWVTESTSAQNNGAGDGTGSYGYFWWTRPFGTKNYPTYYAFGAWGQYIFVVPELSLVSVIACSGPRSSYASRPYFTDYVLEAFQGAE